MVGSYELERSGCPHELLSIFLLRVDIGVPLVRSLV